MSLDRLQTEARNPASTNLDELTPLEIVRLMNREDGRAVEAVCSQAEVIAEAIEQIADRLRAGGRLVYGGAGTSGRLGVLDATECPPTFNSPVGQVVGIIAGGPAALTRAVEGAEDHPEFGEQDLKAIGFSSKDIFLGIATSGRTPYVIGACHYAHSVGAATIGLVCNTESELDGHVDLMIRPVVGPEVLSGSTRLKAGTATKLVLNTLTTGAMVRLGKCFGNLMVDLRATNVKLKARTNRIVRTITGLDEAAASELLDRCGGELKTALVAQQAGVSADDARAKLAEHGGRVGEVLHAFGRPDDTGVAEDLVIGIDGGGSTTVALLATATEVIGRGEAGPSNMQAVGVTRAFKAIEDAVAAAFAESGRPTATVRAAVLGLAGADRQQEQAMVRSWAERIGLASQIEVVNDAQLLLAAGTPEGWGIALVAGTGSIAFGRTRDGRVGRAGGWGYLLGDEGSAYALVMNALQEVAHAADGRGPPTVLTERLLAAIGGERPMDLIPAVYRGGWDRAALAGLAPLILQAAEEGDAVASRSVSQGAHQLALTVAAAAMRLELPPDGLPLAVTGGTLLNSEHYRQNVLQGLDRLGIHADPVTLVHEPAEGGVRLARQKAPRS
jgi:N-acetylmuramic acid 6-phosphate etherase